MSTEWQLLEKEALHSRDYLLPALSNNYRGFQKQGTEIPKLHLRCSLGSLRSRHTEPENLSVEHWALPHAPHLAELHAHGLGCPQLQPQRS